MTFEKGKQYGMWTFIEYGESSRNVSCCQICGKYRKRWYRFEQHTPEGGLIEYTELGSECVKRFDFNQTDPYTTKDGVCHT